VISDDNTEGILLHQFDSARELVVVFTRYFHRYWASLDTGVVNIASADRVNETGVDLHEKRHPAIELTPTISLRIETQQESPTSPESDENTWVSDRKQTSWPLEQQPSYPPAADERHLWPSADEEEIEVVLAGSDAVEEVVAEPTPKKTSVFPVGVWEAYPECVQKNVLLRRSTCTAAS